MVKRRETFIYKCINKELFSVFKTQRSQNNSVFRIENQSGVPIEGAEPTDVNKTASACGQQRQILQTVRIPDLLVTQIHSESELRVGFSRHIRQWWFRIKGIWLENKIKSYLEDMFL